MMLGEVSSFRNETLCIVKCLENEESCPTQETRSLGEVCCRTENDFMWAQYIFHFCSIQATPIRFLIRLKSHCARECKMNPVCDGIEMPINNSNLSCALIKLTEVFNPTYKPTQGKEVYIKNVPETSKNGLNNWNVWNPDMMNWPC